MDALLRDLRATARAARRRPAYTALAILILGLGIGSSTAIFSVVNAVLLRSLPYEEPERIVRIWGHGSEGDQAASLRVIELRAFEEEARSLARVGGDFPEGVTLTQPDGSAERVEAARITHDYFAAFGVRPALGRFFTRAEADEGGELVAIVSHGFWARQLGFDPDVVGKSVTLSDLDFTVVGVLPAGFRPPSGGMPDVYIPYSLGTRRWIGRWLNVYAKLAPGATADQATAELNLLMAGLGESEPRSSGWQVTLESLHTMTVGEVRPALLALIGAVTLVLLIACVNVANLGLVLAHARQDEVAVRLALGASRWQVIRASLLAGLVLAGLGGLLGIGLAFLGVDVLVALAPQSIPRLDEVAVDGAALFAALLISTLAGLIAGAAPAIHSARGTPAMSLRGRARGFSPGRGNQRTLSALVTVEIALSLVLLVGAGLLIRSFVELTGVDVGFERENLVALELSPPRSKYPEPHHVVEYFETVSRRVGGLSGVRAAGVGSNLPLSDRASWMVVNSLERWRGGLTDRVPALQRVAGPAFFSTLGVRVVEGRLFDSRETADGPRRVLINRTLAERLWPSASAVGRRLTTVREPSDDDWMEVIGVVEDLRYQAIGDEPEPQVYEPHTQRAWSSMFLFVRGAAPAHTTLERVRDEVRRMDPAVPISNATTLDAQVSRAVAGERFNVFLFTLFSGIALILALAGIYGVLSFSVAQRLREIGIRMALGARPVSVVTLVLRRGTALLAIGVVLGVAGSLAGGRLLRGLLYGVAPTDPFTFALVVTALGFAVIAASYLPARRASRVDPSVVLREE